MDIGSLVGCLRVIARGLSNNSARSASPLPLPPPPVAATHPDAGTGGTLRLTDDWCLMKIRLPAGHRRMNPRRIGE